MDEAQANESGTSPDERDQLPGPDLDTEETQLAVLPPPPAVPRDILPRRVETALEEIATKLCQNQYGIAAGSYFAAMAAAVGGKRLIAVKASNPQPGNMWNAIIAGSGSGKSDVMMFMMRPFARLNAALDAEYRAAKEAATKDKADGPTYPPLAVLRDTTLEALGQHYQRCARAGRVASAAIMCGELRQGLRSLDCYSSGGRGRGGGLPILLDLHDGEAWINMRVDEQRCFSVDRCYLSLSGGIQTETVREAWTPAMVRDGGFARWLFWRGEPDATAGLEPDPISTETLGVLHGTIQAMLNLPELERYEDRVIPVTPGAREVFNGWYVDGLRRARMGGSWTVSAFQKGSRLTSRIALLLHLADMATGTATEHEVSPGPIIRAIRLWDEYLSRTRDDMLQLVCVPGTTTLAPVHRQAARILLNHLPEIIALHGQLPVNQIRDWLHADGLEITAQQVRHVLGPLKISAGPKRRGERTRVFTKESAQICELATGRRPS